VGEHDQGEHDESGHDVGTWAEPDVGPDNGSTREEHEQRKEESSSAFHGVVETSDVAEDHEDADEHDHGSWHRLAPAGTIPAAGGVHVSAAATVKPWSCPFSWCPPRTRGGNQRFPR
jgi:hypothetical protein